MSSDQATTEEEQQRISQEYKEWKQSVPDLYEWLLEHTVAWPTLTCQWLPTITEGDEFVARELLIGTHTNDEEPNHVQILQVEIPRLDGNGNGQKPQWKITQQFPHDGEVNRARYQPANPNRIASKTREGEVLLFNREKPHEIIRLQGHTKEGYGLEWSPHASTANHLLSAGFDHVICHWDIQSERGKHLVLLPHQRYEGHSDCVEDVSWHATNVALFASVADDKKLMIWDTRSPLKPSQAVQAHTAEVNSVAFNAQQDWMIATGSSDKTIGLFDIRKLDTKLHSFEFHEGEVHQVSWNPHDPAVLASAALDRRIHIWDLRRIGEEQKPEDIEDGPPELLFMHCGHTMRISDFSWDPVKPWVIASAAEDNILQVWEMTKAISSTTQDTLPEPPEDVIE